MDAEWERQEFIFSEKVPSIGRYIPFLCDMMYYGDLQNIVFMFSGCN